MGLAFEINIVNTSFKIDLKGPVYKINALKTLLIKVLITKKYLNNTFNKAANI